VGVTINESRCNNATLGINDLRRATADTSNFNDLAILYTDIRSKSWRT
tara:strand:+ start:822 stop:965 length:144 start_codon:yes stop_codon:yes gene_type:complete